MPTLTFYAIRHKPTGFYLPEPGGRLGRGGSHVNPTDPTIQPPRIWHNRLGARNALSMWLKGKFVASRGQDYDGEYWKICLSSLHLSVKPKIWRLHFSRWRFSSCSSPAVA